MYVNSQNTWQCYDTLMYIPQSIMANAVLKLLDILFRKLNVREQATNEENKMEEPQ